MEVEESAPLQISEQDDRKYLHITLPNKMQVSTKDLCIYDTCAHLFAFPTAVSAPECGVKRLPCCRNDFFCFGSQRVCMWLLRASGLFACWNQTCLADRENETDKGQNPESSIRPQQATTALG